MIILFAVCASDVVASGLRNSQDRTLAVYERRGFASQPHHCCRTIVLQSEKHVKRGNREKEQEMETVDMSSSERLLHQILLLFAPMNAVVAHHYLMKFLLSFRKSHLKSTFHSTISQFSGGAFLVPGDLCYRIYFRWIFGGFAAFRD